MLPRYIAEGEEKKISYFVNAQEQAFIWRDNMWRGPYPSLADAFNDQLIPLNEHPNHIRQIPV